MNKKIFLACTTVVLFACNFLVPPKPAATPQPVDVPPTEAISQPSPLPLENATPRGFSVVRLHPEDGDLEAMLAKEAEKAIGLHQLPVVEFDATWCPPCQAIERAIKDKNELMMQAYAGTYIIKLDVDEWGWDNGRVQDFRFQGIPVYFKLDEQGAQTGAVIDGGAWDEDIPENIAPVMDAFFHEE